MTLSELYSKYGSIKLTHPKPHKVIRWFIIRDVGIGFEVEVSSGNYMSLSYTHSEGGLVDVIPYFDESDFYEDILKL